MWNDRRVESCKEEEKWREWRRQEARGGGVGSDKRMVKSKAHSFKSILPTGDS